MTTDTEPTRILVDPDGVEYHEYPDRMELWKRMTVFQGWLLIDSYDRKEDS